NQFLEAKQLLGEALELLRAQNRQNLEAEVYWALGRSHEGLGELADALGCYQNALELCRKLSYLDYEWRALWRQANIFAVVDNREQARVVVAEAITVIERLREQLPEGANLKAFQEDKQPVYDLKAELETV